jgi:tetratricopeptide (TPR) repeat protein
MGRPQPAPVASNRKGPKTMKSQSLRIAAAVAAVFVAPLFVSSTRVSAQQTPATPPSTQPAPAPNTQPGQAAAPSDLPNALPPATIDPAEETDYKAFVAIPATDADKRIAAGDAFVAKYPAGHYTGAVYSTLTQMEYQKQDVPKVEADGEKAIAANPDDISTLIIVGSIIPRAYDPNKPDAAKQLDQAEAYEKHALTLIPNLQKPANLTDEQFATVKSDATVQAHSALGLIYFRKQNVEGCVTELKSATDNPKSPDATDFYVLGICQKAQKNFADAADSFGKCAALPSGLASRCKDAADDAKKQAPAKPSLSK